MHWSLFIFFNHENGRNCIIDLFFQDSFVLENRSPVRLRKLLRLRKPLRLRRFVFAFTPSSSKKPSLPKQRSDEEKRSEVQAVDLLRWRRRQRFSMLAEKLNMNIYEAERWIVNLVRNSMLDAKIESVAGTVIMGTNLPNVHGQIIESMKNLNMRAYVLAKSILDPAQAAQAAR